MNELEHLANVLIAAVLTVVCGLSAATLMWFFSHLPVNVATPPDDDVPSRYESGLQQASTL